MQMNIKNGVEKEVDFDMEPLQAYVQTRLDKRY